MIFLLGDELMPQENKKPLGDVLIVDDDADLCNIVKSYCKNMGCFRNILIANDGSNASAKMRNQKFALILLDVNMPKKKGMAALINRCACELLPWGKFFFLFGFFSCTSAPSSLHSLLS